MGVLSVAGKLIIGIGVIGSVITLYESFVINFPVAALAGAAGLGGSVYVGCLGIAVDGMGESSSCRMI